VTPKDAKALIATRTPNVPGHTRMVDRAKYEAMKKLVLKVTPRRAPGITGNETIAAVGKIAPNDVFPRDTYHWWAKCVQLDLEARGALVRETSAKPLRWHRA
jgi:hypothetical protein